MRVATAALLGALAATGVAAAQDDERIERCLMLSFAPLDDTIPACTALIEDSGGLDPQALADVLAARAEALQFALTYHGDREISPEALLADALADLDRAVAIDPRHQARRGDILFQLSRFDEAAASYTAAIAADWSAAPAMLEYRSAALEAAGDMIAAIDDMTAAIRLSTSAPEIRRRTLRRAELREAAGDVVGALADYELALRRDPDDAAAAAAIERLSGD